MRHIFLCASHGAATYTPLLPPPLLLPRREIGHPCCACSARRFRRASVAEEWGEADDGKLSDADDYSVLSSYVLRRAWLG